MHVNNLGFFEILMCFAAIAVALFLFFNSTRGGDKARRKKFLGAGLIMVSFMCFALDLASRTDVSTGQQGVYIAPVPAWLYYAVMCVGIVYMMVGYANQMKFRSKASGANTPKTPRTRAKKAASPQPSDASLLPGGMGASSD